MAKKKESKPNKPKKSPGKSNKSSPPPMAMEVTTGKHTYRYEDITKVHPSLKNFFCYCLNKVALRHKNQLENALTKLDLQALHLGVLRVIERGDEKVNQNKLGEQMGIDKASTVKIIDRLENLKLIERVQCSKDRRVNFLKITTKGSQCLAEAKRIAEVEEKEFLKGISEEESRQFKETLLKILG